MRLDAIGIKAGGSSVTGAPTTRGLGDINSQDFFQLIISQLQRQDPLKPADNQAILEQISLVRQLESSTQLTNTLSSMVAQQRLGNTASLIGKYVIGTDATAGGGGTPAQGVVIGVSYTPGGQAILELQNGQRLPSENVESVTLVENLPTADAAAGSSATSRLQLSDGTTAKPGLTGRWGGILGRLVA